MSEKQTLAMSQRQQFVAELAAPSVEVFCAKLRPGLSVQFTRGSEKSVVGKTHSSSGIGQDEVYHKVSEVTPLVWARDPRNDEAPFPLSSCDFPEETLESNADRRDARVSVSAFVDRSLDTELFPAVIETIANKIRSRCMRDGKNTERRHVAIDRKRRITPRPVAASQ